MNTKDLMASYLDSDPPSEGYRLNTLARQRILNDALAKAGLSKPRKRVSSKRLFALVAAAALAIGCVSAAASDKLHLNGAFSQLFGSPSQTQLDQLEASGSVLGQSASADGVTITLDGAVGDRKSAYVFFSVQLPQDYEAPVSAEDTPWFWFHHFSLWTENGGSQGYHVELLSREENTLRFFLSLDNDQPLAGQTIQLTLSELKEASGEEGQMVAEGPWEFSFPLEYTDASVRIPLSGTVKPVADRDLCLTGLWVSPLSLQLEFTRPVSILWDRDELNTSQLLDLDISLHMADGTVISGEQLLKSNCSSRGLSVQLNLGYRALIETSQLTGIQIEDTWIPVQ